VLFSEPKIPQSINDNLKCDAIGMFQCSSASRKFLNYTFGMLLLRFTIGFSALQRAENSSIAPEGGATIESVSVLFSEPKIPQYPYAIVELLRVRGFSALQRAENSSIHQR